MGPLDEFSYKGPTVFLNLDSVLKREFWLADRNTAIWVFRTISNLSKG